MAITLNGSSGISGVNGSATTPALQGADSNTGIVFGTDTVQVSTGGSTRATVDSSGRVLIGTASGSTSQFLQIQGDTGASNNGGTILLKNGVADSSASNGTGLGGIAFGGSTGNQYCRIEGFADGSGGTNDYPGRLTFSTTADGASSPTERMRITHEGYMRFGQSTSDSPGYGNTTTGISMLSDGRIFSSMGGTFSQFNRNADGAVLSFARSSTGVGTISVTSSSTSYGTSSDYRLKENVVALDGAITRVKQLLPKRFNFIVDADTTVDGFLAHEAQTVVPEAVTGTHNEVDDDNNPVYQGIDQSKLVPLLTAALQEAIGKIEALETKVAALEAA